MKRLLLIALAVFLCPYISAQNSDAAKSQTTTATESAAPDNELCLTCHTEMAGKLKGHAHANVACSTCHVKHEEYPHPADIPKPVCANCHVSIANDYSRSEHAQQVKAGNGAAPECGTCHGTAHELTNPKTAEFRAKIPDTCGGCHIEVLEQYRQSIHGQAISRGMIQAPVCTDCHGEHAIIKPDNAASSVNAAHIRETCAGCHNDVRLSRRFALPRDRVMSFDASYHGLASKTGSQTVANCASCHGVHNILPSSDPRSTVNAKNLAATCGKCHNGASSKYAMGRVHLMAGESTEPASVRWVRYFYLLVIPGTLGFMLLHNAGDWVHKVRKLRFGKAAPEPVKAEPEIRMYRAERYEHFLMAFSFIVLSATGFALKYSDQPWAKPLLLWEQSISARGIVHRAASVLFMSVGFAHVLTLLLDKKLREHWFELMPTWNDGVALIQGFLFNLGLRSTPPRPASHGYIEKLEYWALIWGSIVMVVSGVLLWANNLVLQYGSKIVLDVATEIHFYEAVLATLAIVIWHFYFVIFDPEVYPMDTAWLTGKSPRPQHHIAPQEEQAD